MKKWGNIMQKNFSSQNFSEANNYFLHREMRELAPVLQHCLDLTSMIIKYLVSKKIIIVYLCKLYNV